MNKARAAEVINEEIKRETSKALPLPVILTAIERVDFSCEPLTAELEQAARNAEEVGLLKCPDNMKALWELRFVERHVWAKPASGRPTDNGK